MKYLAALVMAAMCAAFVVGYSPTTAIDCGGGDDDDDTGDDDTGDDDTGSGPDALKVITFNLRYANLVDFPNHWAARDGIVFDYLNGQSPDVFGVQEGLLKQLEDIEEGVPGYAWVGVSRYGNTDNEYSAVFYKTSRLELIDSGTFWLSDTPDVVGSKFSDAQSLPRICTWAELEIIDSGARFFIFNSHWDTSNADSIPQRSAVVIIQKVAELAPDAPVIVTGDFNENVGTAAYRIMTGALTYNDVTGDFIDPWPVLDLPEGGTFHNFTGTPTSSSRIDWILATDDFTPTAGEISTYNEDDKYPSDHFPVMVEYELGE